MRRRSEREAVLAGPGEPASRPLLVELMKLSLPVTTQSLDSYPPPPPPWFTGTPAHPGTRGAQAWAGVSRRERGVSEGGGGRGEATVPKQRVGLGHGDQGGAPLHLEKMLAWTPLAA